jgi:hypothetical protein
MSLWKQIASSWDTSEKLQKFGERFDKGVKMSLVVIGTGLSRTGTTTIRKVVEELGFGPCYHSTDLFIRPRGIEFWEALEKGNKVDFEEFFSQYNAIIGFPGYLFHQQLKDKYPDAKVILSYRDPDVWYEDVSNTIFKSESSHVKKAYPEEVRTFDPYLADCILRIQGLQKRMLEENYFIERFEEKDFAIQRYIEWNEDIKKIYSGDDLLVYQVTEGWGPICEFLGVPVPEEKPYPHLNDSDTFHKRSTSGFLEMLKEVEGL